MTPGVATKLSVIQKLSGWKLDKVYSFVSHGATVSDWKACIESRFGGRSLKRMSQLPLRTGERVSYEASEAHKQQVRSVASELAQRLRKERE